MCVAIFCSHFRLAPLPNAPTEAMHVFTHVFLVLLSTSGSAGAFNGGSVSHAYAACLAACGGTCPLFGPLACYDWCLASCRPLADLGTDGLLLLHNAKDGSRRLGRDTVPKTAVGITSTLSESCLCKQVLATSTSACCH